jgi:hypothetical protein
MSDEENKEREDEFSTEVNVVLEEEEGLKEEKNDTNRLPNIIVNKEKVSEIQERKIVRVSLREPFFLLFAVFISPVFCCLFETLNYKP